MKWLIRFTTTTWNDLPCLEHNTKWLISFWAPHQMIYQVFTTKWSDLSGFEHHTKSLTRFYQHTDSHKSAWDSCLDDHTRSQAWWDWVRCTGAPVLYTHHTIWFRQVQTWFRQVTTWYEMTLLHHHNISKQVPAWFEQVITCKHQQTSHHTHNVKINKMRWKSRKVAQISTERCQHRDQMTLHVS